MTQTPLEPAPLPARAGALFIDLVVPAMLSFWAGIGAWVGTNLLWSTLIHNGGLDWIPPHSALSLLGPSVYGATAIGALGPIFLWVLAELWLLTSTGQTWGLREQRLRVVADHGSRLVVRTLSPAPTRLRR